MVTATRSPRPHTTWASEKTTSLEPCVGTTSASGSSATPKRRPTHAATAARSSGSPAADGYADTGWASSAATSAAGTNAGVGSRGSPTPKSMTSTPRAAAAAFASFTRAKG